MVFANLVSCAADDSIDEGVRLDGADVSVCFEGRWILDGQVIGTGMVSLDSILVFTGVPVAEITSVALEHNTSSSPVILATAARQQMEAVYVGVSSTSRYYDLPATQMTFNATVDGVACNVKLRTAQLGSVALLQESKNSLSVVVKVVQTLLEQVDNGKVVADSKQNHTLAFESDTNK